MLIDKNLKSGNRIVRLGKNVGNLFWLAVCAVEPILPLKIQQSLQFV